MTIPVRWYLYVTISGALNMGCGGDPGCPMGSNVQACTCDDGRAGTRVCNEAAGVVGGCVCGDADSGAP